MISVVAAALLALALVGCGVRLRAWRRPAGLAAAVASPYLIAAAVPGLALSAAAGQWAGVSVGAVLLVAGVSVLLPRLRRVPKPVDGVSLRVLTLNLRLGGADAAAVVELVRRHRVDLMMVQELTASSRERLACAGLDAELAHHVVEPRPNAAGTGLWSRHPLGEARVVAGFTFAAVSARVRVPDCSSAPEAFALHLAGPARLATPWLRDIDELLPVMRALASDAPCVVGGDFNATWDTRQFRALLSGGFEDAAAQRGAALLPTYPVLRWCPPLFALDHLLVRDATTTAVRLVRAAGSDHFGLIIDVTLVPRPNIE